MSCRILKKHLAVNISVLIKKKKKDLKYSAVWFLCIATDVIYLLTADCHIFRPNKLKGK